MTRRRDPKIARKVAILLRKLREKKFPGRGGKSAAANEFGVSTGCWSMWESGKTVPDDVNQRKLAAFFGVTLAELRGDHSPPPVDEGSGGDSDRQDEARAVVQKAVADCLGSMEPSGDLTPVEALEALQSAIGAKRVEEEAKGVPAAPPAARPLPKGWQYVTPIEIPVVATALAAPNGQAELHHDPYEPRDPASIKEGTLAVTVDGDSAAPVALKGQKILVMEDSREPRAGDIVVVEAKGETEDKIYFKRWKGIKNGVATFESINKESYPDDIKIPKGDIWSVRVAVGVLFKE